MLYGVIWYTQLILVAIQQVGMSAPGKQWLLFWIIIREVILWQTNGQALMEVAPILLCKCVAIIFKMTGYKNLVEISLWREVQDRW